MKAAFQGVHGANSEVAARQLLGRTVTTVPCERFVDVFSAVESGKADRGVIPIENSLAGSIHENYDLLLSHRLTITGELHLRIEHALLCHPAASLESLHAIRSHPQALAQCSKFFARHRAIRPEAFFDTAGAAQSVMEESSRTIGAIANAYAAKLYRMKILKRNIENETHNFTRFLLIARTPWKPRIGTPSKTSLAFRPAANVPGILFRMLGVFSLRDIDLLKIESRPDPRKAFEYSFYVDLAGNPAELRVRNALDHLQEMASMLRILGSYPMGEGSVYGAQAAGRKNR